MNGKTSVLEWLFWIACAVAVLVFVFGCAERGHVQTRFCEEMDCATGTTRWRIVEGEPVWCGKPVQFFYCFSGGLPIRQAGLRMTQYLDEDVVWVDGAPYGSELTDCEIDEFTGVGGINEGLFHRNWAPRSYKVFTAGVGMCRPGDPDIKADVGFATVGVTDPESYPRYIAWQDDCSVGDKYIAFEPPVTGQLTQAQYDLLMDPDPVLPDVGIEIDCVLVQQQGERGNGFVVEMADGIVPLNYSGADALFQYAAPMMYSYTVTTAEPVGAFVGQYSQALIKTHIASVPVGLSVTDSNVEGTVFVAVTDPFLVVAEEYYDPEMPVAEVYDRWSYSVDPNALDIHDPNFVVDPNRIIECPVLPMSEEDVLRVEFIGASDFMSFFSGSGEWLGSNRTFDVNQDGIVNLKDWMFLF